MSRTITVGIALLSVLLLAAAVAVGVALSRSDEALQGVSVEGIDVGGLGDADMRDALQPLADQRSTAPVVVMHEDRSFTVEPSAVGVDFDMDDVVARAIAAGRDQGGTARFETELRGETSADLDVVTELDGEAVTEQVAAIAAELDTPVVDGDVTVDPQTLVVDAVLPADGLETDVEATAELVAEAFRIGDTSEVTAVTTVLPTLVPTDSVEETAAQFERAVAAPLVLRGNGNELVLQPRDIATMLVSRRAGPDADARVELGVDEDAVKEIVRSQVEPLLTAPVDASFVAPKSPPVRFDDKDDAVWRPVRDVGVQVVEGSEGTRFGIIKAVAQLEQLFMKGTREADLRLAVLEPDLTTQQARDAGVDDLLSTFTTYHVCCQPRVTNIQRLADVVDGTEILPGEQFSINGISGERTCGKGYAEDGMILRGEIVDVCGGGVSQFGTTTVNAVFFAGISPDAYKPHSFYISRYPMAREATLNYPNLDVAWTNTTGAPVIVRTSYSPESITVSFYGNADDLTEVRADVGSPSEITPFPKERRRNSELPKGAVEQVQGGRDGFYVPLERTVVRPSGTSTDGWGFRYVPETEITEFN